MEVGRINSINNATAYRQNPVNKSGRVAFKAASPSKGSSIGKKCWLWLRHMSERMKDVTEKENAIIAAIGTGIIAPAIILVSPGKGDQEDKNKKKIQALRQPLSAALQLSFQLPATYFINLGIDELGYEKHLKWFNDDKIGSLIPTESYISKKLSDKEIKVWEDKFEQVIDGKSLKQELEEKIKRDYEEVGLKISDEDLAKRVQKDKDKFLRKKIAKEKFEQLKEEKVQDILNNKDPKKYSKLVDIKDIDLVTQDYQDLAEHRFNAEYKKLEADANLSTFDKIIRSMGFETKRTKKLDDAQKAFKKEKGLELLKKDNPEIFKDKAKKIRNFIETHQKDAEKVFSNKKFCISLFVNLFMVTASCFALNWLHPRVNKKLEERCAVKEAAKREQRGVK